MGVVYEEAKAGKGKLIEGKVVAELYTCTHEWFEALANTVFHDVARFWRRLHLQVPSVLPP